MRLFINCLIGMTFSISAFGQGYIKMIDTTLEWQGCFNYYKNGQNSGGPIKYKFINKDTIFKSDTFKILMAYTPVDTFAAGALREDTALRKIFGFYSGDTSSYLMYDFSYPIGVTDTLWINKSDTSSKYLISTSIYTDQFSRKYRLSTLCCGYSFNNSNKYKTNEFYWIEGFGGTVGVLNNVIINKLPQFKQPNTPVFPMHYLGIRSIKRFNSQLFQFGCDFDTVPTFYSVNKITFEQEVYVSYNVNENTIQVSSQKLPLKNIKIFSIEGKVIEVWENLDCMIFNLPTLDATSGLYIIEIQISNGNTYRKKVTIN